MAYRKRMCGTRKTWKNQLKSVKIVYFFIYAKEIKYYRLIVFIIIIVYCKFVESNVIYHETLLLITYCAVFSTHFRVA